MGDLVCFLSLHRSQGVGVEVLGDGEHHVPRKYQIMKAPGGVLVNLSCESWVKWDCDWSARSVENSTIHDHTIFIPYPSHIHDHTIPHSQLYPPLTLVAAGHVVILDGELSVLFLELIVVLLYSHTIQ